MIHEDPGRGRESWCLAVVAFLVMAVAADRSGAAEPSSSAPVLIEIGAEKVTVERFLLHLRQIGPHIDLARLPPAEQERLAADYVEKRLFAHHARQEGLDREPEVTARIEFFTDSVLAQAVKDRLRQGIAVAEEEVVAYYEARRQEFVEPPRYLVEHLVYGREGEAVAARRRLAHGSLFTELAGERGPDLLYSERSWLTPQLLLPALAEAAAGLEAGETSAVVETSHGFHVLRLAARESERQQELDEVRARIIDRIRQGKVGELYREALAELKAARPVRFHLERLRADD